MAGLWFSQLQQLLDGDAGREVVVLSAGADVGGQEMLDAEEVAEVIDVADAVETGRGRFPSNLKTVLVPVGKGLMRTGERLLRKSR